MLPSGTEVKLGGIHPAIDEERHRSRIAALLGRIRAGDLYQVSAPKLGIKKRLGNISEM